MRIEGAAGGLIDEIAALLTPYGKERELLLYSMRCLSKATQIAVAVYMHVSLVENMHHRNEINDVDYNLMVCDKLIDYVREKAALWPRPTVMQMLASETMQASVEERRRAVEHRKREIARSSFIVVHNFGSKVTSCSVGCNAP